MSLFVCFFSIQIRYGSWGARRPAVWWSGECNACYVTFPLVFYEFESILLTPYFIGVFNVTEAETSHSASFDTASSGALA